jgi:hypothetical protein
MTLRRTLSGLLLLATSVGATAPGLAANLTLTLKGTVKNGTSGRPAGRVEVVLVAPTSDVKEIARSKADAAGRFRLAVTALKPPYLLRVIHQGIAYHRLVAIGDNAIEIQVYDRSEQVERVTAILDMQRIQAQGDTLQVIEEIALDNGSKPPRTLVTERPFEIQLPPEAVIVASAVQTAGGQAVQSTPAQGGKKGRYYFAFPLLPGVTRYALAYQLPYRGKAVIAPKIFYPLAQFAVVLPKTMQFEAKPAGRFHAIAANSERNVQMMAAIDPAQPLEFVISGRGILPKTAGEYRLAQAGATAFPGGLPTRNAWPNERWLILGGSLFTLASAAAGFLVYKRKRSKAVSM